MIETVDIINLILVSGGMMVALLGFLTTIFLPYAEKRSKKFFIIVFLLLMAYTISDLTSQISLVFAGSGYATLSQIAIFCESLFSSLMMLLFTSYLTFYTKKPQPKSPFMIVVFVLWLVYIILLDTTWFSNAIYSISSDNVYMRGEYYPILLVPPMLMLVLNLIYIILKRKVLSKGEFRAFILYLILPLISTVIQMFSYGLLMIVIGTSLASLIMLVVINHDQITSYFHQKEENFRISAENMALQMRPHFIYNVLMSIYYLINSNPEKAQQVTLDFTSYLRKNFTAVARKDVVPFTEELEHTRAYLNVEQVRFDGRLFADFVIPHTNFHLPPLSLQPIVENAVKHGVDPELDPLHIYVSTKKVGDCSQIIVEDDGVGIITEKKNNDPHIALENIKKRLELLCGGSLTITSREGGGTKVVITIPSEPPLHKKRLDEY